MERIMQLLLQVTWETPCCQALLAGSWSYWTTGPRTQGCAAWQFQVGCVTGSCHWGAEQWGVWATKGPSWDSEHYLRHKQISLSFFLYYVSLSLQQWCQGEISSRRFTSRHTSYFKSIPDGFFPTVCLLNGHDSVSVHPPGIKRVIFLFGHP